MQECCFNLNGSPDAAPQFAQFWASFSSTYSSSSQSCQLVNRRMKCIKKIPNNPNQINKKTSGGVTEPKAVFSVLPEIVDIFYTAVLSSIITSNWNTVG